MDFFSKNSRSILIIGILIALWMIAFVFSRSNASVDGLLEKPKKGQIYIFQEGNHFAPMRLDSLSETELFMRNYQFLFADAIPKRGQIQNNEFDTVFYAVYQKEELKRLFKAGNLVHIYP